MAANVRPRDRSAIRARGGGSGIAGLASFAPDFFNNPTLVDPKTGLAISLTRATTATYTDQDLIVRTALAGMARMQGMRVVRNIIATSSEDLRIAGNWVEYAVALTSCTIDTSDFPPGTTQSTVFVSGGAFRGRKQNTALTIGRTYIARFWAKGAVGGESVWCNDNGGGGGFVTVTTSWQLYCSNVFVAPDAILALGLSAAGTVKFSGIQFEDVTGQSIQTPGEYQSVGVMSYPYQGLGIDGACAYTYLNPNVVV